MKPVSRHVYLMYRGIVVATPIAVKQAVKDALGYLFWGIYRFFEVSEKRSGWLVAANIRLARITGVNSKFIERANIIHKRDYSTRSALRLLVYYIRLSMGLAPADNAFNIKGLLEDPVEISTTISLLKQALPQQRDQHSKHLIRGEILRLENADAQNPNVRALAQEIIDASVAKRREQQKKQATASKLSTHAQATLASIINIFDANNHRFFLVSGTLLGARRDGSIVTGDNDIDLGVFADEIDKTTLKKMFSDSGFFVDRDFEYEIALISPKGVLVEFFFCERTQSSLLMRSFGNSHVWCFKKFELVETQFLGLPCLVPDHTDQHLTENFGNWRDNVVIFDWAFDVPCADWGSKLETAALCAERFSQAMEDEDRFQAEQSLNALKLQLDVDFTHILPRPG